MNWILRKSNKFDYHTNLKAVINPIINDLQRFIWLIADLEYISFIEQELPVNMDDEYFILSSKQFARLLEVDMQIIWGVLIAIPEGELIDVDNSTLPYAEGNELIWKNGNLQHPNAIVEVVCFDSGYTIVKFEDETLSNKFKLYFPEAIELEKFRNKSAPYF